MWIREPNQAGLRPMMDRPFSELQIFAQVVEIVDEVAKLGWLTSRLADFIDQGDVLVFANQKVKVDEVNGKLQSAGVR
jgi:hypothetical protein